jgi:hypothetical protein
LHLAGAEDIFDDGVELYHKPDEGLKDAWMDFIIAHCGNPHIK